MSTPAVPSRTPAKSPSVDPELEAYRARLGAWATSLKPGLVEAVSAATPWADGKFWSWVLLDREGRQLRHSMNAPRPEAARLLAVLQGSDPPAPEKWDEISARIHLWRSAGSWQTEIGELRALPDRAESAWLEENRLALKLETGRWTPAEGVQVPEPGGAPVEWLLQFASRPSLARRAELKAQGIALERYVTGSAYLARLSGDAPRALASLAELRAALPPPPGLPATLLDPVRLSDLQGLPPEEALEAVAKWKRGREEGGPPVPLGPADLDVPDVAFDRELDSFRERLECWLEEHAPTFEVVAAPTRRRTKIPYRIWWRAGRRGLEDSGNPLDEGVSPLLARLARLLPVPLPRCCRGVSVVVHLGYLGPQGAWGGRLISVRVAPSREMFIERHTTAYEVHLKGRGFYPERRIDAEGIRAAKGRRGDRVHFLVQLMADAPLPWRKTLESMGVQVFDSAGGYCLVASAPEGVLDALASVEGVRAAFPLLPSDKKGDGVSDGRFDAWALLPDGRVKLYLRFHQDADQAHAEAQVRELGGEVAQVEWPFRTMRVVGPPKLGDALAELDEVQYVAEAEPPLMPA